MQTKYLFPSTECVQHGNLYAIVKFLWKGLLDRDIAPIPPFPRQREVFSPVRVSDQEDILMPAHKKWVCKYVERGRKKRRRGAETKTLDLWPTPTQHEWKCLLPGCCSSLRVAQTAQGDESGGGRRRRACYPKIALFVIQSRGAATLDLSFGRLFQETF